MANKNAYYFSHDCNARRDEKLLAVRMRHKAEGYGVYFMIVEMLAEEPTHMCLKDYNMIAFELRVGAETVKSIVEDFGLFQFTDDGERFYSESLMERMSDLDNLKEKRRAAGRKGNETRWGKSQNVAFAIKNGRNCDDLRPEIIATKQNKEKIKDYNSSTSDENARDAHAYVREHVPADEPPQPPSPPPNNSPQPPSSSAFAIQPVHELVALTLDEINARATWVDNAARLYHLSPSSLSSYLNTFADKLAVDGITHKSFADFRRHFNSWLRIQVTNQNPNNTPTHATTNTNRRTVTKPTNGYETDF